MPKLLFIDANIFVKECLEKHSPIKFLETLLRLLDEHDIVIAMPEITKSEVLREIDSKTAFILETIDKHNFSGIEDSLVEHLKSEQVSIVRGKQKTTSEYFQRLLDHSKVKSIPISNNLILACITRQLRRIAPSSKGSGKTDGLHSFVDNDCLAFESVISEGRNGGYNEIILFTDDKDYYFDKDKGMLKPPLDQEILSLPDVTCVSASNDVWSLLGLKLGVVFDEEVNVKRADFWEYPSQLDEIKSLTPPPGSIIKGQTLTCLYWFGYDGARYAIVNEDILRSWFPETSPQPTVYQVTDSLLASISLGGNITYRAGSRLIKIESDPKIYAVGNEGLIHWVTTEKTIEKIFGFHWKNLLVTIPDALFANYSVESSIDFPEDFDPEEAKRLDRLP